MKWIKPLEIGTLTLPSNIIYSPLAGCSDYPFRQMASLFKPGLMYCEMVKMEALIRREKNTFRLLDYVSAMRPIGAQLVGSNIKIAAESARIIEDCGFDVIDFNCGCPVDKVTKDGSGSGMLKTPELIGEMIATMTHAVKVPVTVKIRTGWDESTINAPLITQIAEKAGAKAIAIHGRTRRQKYTGPANWDHITACKKVAKTIKVLGNGDVFNANAGLNLFKTSGCDGILVSRGTMGQPWIAEDIRLLDEGKERYRLNGEKAKALLLNHMTYIIAYQKERQAILDMRRVGCWYLRKGKGTKKLRESLNRAKSLSEIKTIIMSYDWNETCFKEQQ